MSMQHSVMESPHCPRRWIRRFFDRDFAACLVPDHAFAHMVCPVMSMDCYRPWRQMATAARDIGSNIKVNKDKFQVNVDVQHFTPEEIFVKTVNGYVVVEAKHEDIKDEHGYISRQFVRRYALPEGTLPETVESHLSSDGVLTITTPRKVAEVIKGERTVPITQTGPIRKEVEDQKEPALDEKKIE